MPIDVLTFSDDGQFLKGGGSVAGKLLGYFYRLYAILHSLARESTTLGIPSILDPRNPSARVFW